MEKLVAKWMEGCYFSFVNCGFTSIIVMHRNRFCSTRATKMYYITKYWEILADLFNSNSNTFSTEIPVAFLKLNLQHLFFFKFYTIIKKLLHPKEQWFSFAVPITAFPKAHMPSKVKMLDTKKQFVKVCSLHALLNSIFFFSGALRLFSHL